MNGVGVTVRLLPSRQSTLLPTDDEVEDGANAVDENHNEEPDKFSRRIAELPAGDVDDRVEPQKAHGEHEADEEEPGKENDHDEVSRKTI